MAGHLRALAALLERDTPGEPGRLVGQSDGALPGYVEFETSAARYLVGPEGGIVSRRPVRA
jgi:hypothetical protein